MILHTSTNLIYIIDNKEIAKTVKNDDFKLVEWNTRFIIKNIDMLVNVEEGE